ncbi:ABC transporter substrate-binding protein [Paenibacillus sp. TAB 01]|uniref:ABC transporter substrate-binding protein n=1 Tax=Paenibacillus sp. TAB 01 TaxID=3368988 RepID=UPI0037516F9E
MLKKATILLGALTLLLQAACSAPTSSSPGSAGTQEASAGEAKAASEPVTLKFYTSSGTLTNTEFKALIADPVHAKYPNITIERAEPPTGTTPEDYFSSGANPDLIYSSSTTHTKMISIGVYQDLRELIQKYKFDESRIKPFLYNYAKGLAPNGEIWAIPFNSNQHILYYNKDIFDKFGVPYPSDQQMTWEQAIELGRQLTRTENGVNYIGIDAEGCLSESPKTWRCP